MRETVLSETLSRQTLIVRRSHMRTNLPCATVAAIAVLATLILPYAVAAQSIWLDGQSRKDVTLEFYQPQFKYVTQSGYDWESWSEFSGQVFFLTYRSQISEKVVLVAELPYASGSYTYGSFSYDYSYWGFYWTDSDSYETSGKALGNPYIGIESGSEGTTLSYEFGVRIPTLWECHSSAADAGMFADFDRFEAFACRSMTIQSAGNVSVRCDEGFVGHARLAPCYMMCLGCSGTSAQLLLHYSAQVGYEGKPIAVLSGLTGVTTLSHNYFLEEGNSSVYQLGFQANVSLGKVKPGVHLRIPLDYELNKVYSSVWGLNLQYQFE
jgi:hypothetical protein